MVLRRALAVSAWLAVASGAADSHVSSGILAESDFFRHRLDEPQSHFLLDGWQGFISGREFYEARGETAPFLWPAHPFLAITADRAWEADSGFMLRAALGNEIGDAMLQELTVGAESAKDNHTPLTAGEAGWSPLPGLRVHGRLDQNDHFSYTTLPARNALIGEAQRDGMAWFGGNVPPKSQADMGVAYRHGPATVSAQYDRGWWWTASPASGRVYPWEGGNLLMSAGWGPAWELRLIDQRWESPATDDFFSARWRRSEAALGFSGSAGSEWGWRLEAGWQDRELESGAAFRGFRERSFPLGFRYWSSGTESMAVRGYAGARDAMLATEHAADFKQDVGAHRISERVRAYYRHPMGGFHAPSEAFAGDSAFAAIAAPGRHARGFSGEAGYRHERAGIEAGISGSFAMEWGVPEFRTNGLDTVAGAIVRRGAYAGGAHALKNGTVRIFAGNQSLAGKSFWKADAGIREFMGEGAAAIEFRPSRYWAGGCAGWRFPSDLDLELRVDYLGEKEVRGWGPVFVVPAHFENNLGLTQSVFEGTMRFSFSLLHAFGREVREQPNGNPLRFRVLGGMEADF